MDGWKCTALQMVIIHSGQNKFSFKIYNSDQELVKHGCIFLHLSIHAGGMQAQLIDNGIYNYN